MIYLLLFPLQHLLELPKILFSFNYAFNYSLAYIHPAEAFPKGIPG